MTTASKPEKQDIPPETPGTSWFVPNLRFLLLLLALLLTLFTLTRVGLVWLNWTPGAATKAQMVRAFAIGVRFDLAMAAYIAMPVMLACYIPWTAPSRGRKTRRVFLWLLTIVLSIFALILMAEWEFFREFQSRFNQLAIRYFDHPKIVGGMIWYNYPIGRYTLLWLVMATAIYFAVRLALYLAFGPWTREQRPTLLAQAASAVLVAVMLVISARGGLQHEPLRWGDAFGSTSEFANQVGLNGLQSLANTIHDMLTRGKVAGRWVGELPLEDARSVVRHMILAPGERLLDPTHRTVLREGNVGSNLVLARPDGKPLNVVVVMMESFSARFVGACGAPRSFTPSFDAIAKGGILFDHAFSAGSHTHQGIFATQLGFPNLPGFESLMESSASNQDFLSLAKIFQKRSYSTFFLYNGDFAWDNMRGFFSKQGIDTFISGADMKRDAKFLDAVWGVSDGDLFDRANREFEAAGRNGPFYGQIMTLSNHAPYQVPPVPGAPPITDMGGDYNKRLEAMRYADYALGQFIEQAKKLDYYKNTLFVFVGDHGFHVAPILTEVQLLYHHVPLLFYAPFLTDRRGVDHRVACQINILPSVLGLLGINDAPQASWGRSLFNDSFPDENFAVFKMTGGGTAVAMARGDKLLVLGSSSGRPLLMTYDIGLSPNIKPIRDELLLKKMERELRAYLQTAIDDLNHHRAGPVEKEDRLASRGAR